MVTTYGVFAYSALKKGLICRTCVLFAPHEAGGVKLDRLVKSPLQKYAHLTGRDGHLTTHLVNAFHEDCENKAREFRAGMRSNAGDVTQQLHFSFSLQREQNRSALKRILQAIEVLGRLGLLLRGHRDYGVSPLPGNTT